MAFIYSFWPSYALRKSADMSQVGVIPFSPFYPIFCLCIFPGFCFTLISITFYSLYLSPFLYFGLLSILSFNLCVKKGYEKYMEKKEKTPLALLEVQGCIKIKKWPIFCVSHEDKYWYSWCHGEGVTHKKIKNYQY